MPAPSVENPVSAQDGGSAGDVGNLGGGLIIVGVVIVAVALGIWGFFLLRR